MANGESDFYQAAMEEIEAQYYNAHQKNKGLTVKDFIEGKGSVTLSGPLKDLLEGKISADADGNVYINRSGLYDRNAVQYTDSGTKAVRETGTVIQDVVRSITAKQRGYNWEWASLASTIQGKTTIDDINKAINGDNFANGLLQNMLAADPEFALMWASASSNSGHTADDIISYIQNKAYGGSTRDRLSKRRQTTESIDRGNALYQIAISGRPMTVSEVEQAASYLGTTASDYRNRQQYWNGIWQQIQTEDTDSLLRDTRADALQILGETDTDGSRRFKRYNELDDAGKQYVQRLRAQGFEVTGATDDATEPIAITGYTPQSVDLYEDLKDYSQQFTSNWLAAVATGASELGSRGLDWNTIVDSLKSGEYDGQKVTDEAIRALEQYSPELARWLKMSPDQRKTDEGRLLEQQFKVKIQTEGLDTLVQLGELSENIAAALKDIQKGGKIKLDAEVSLTQTSNQLGQTINVMSGTQGSNARDQAIMSLYSLSAEQYYPNRAQWIERANQYYDSEEYRDRLTADYQKMYSAGEIDEAGVIALGGNVISETPSDKGQGKKVVFNKGYMDRATKSPLLMGGSYGVIGMTDAEVNTFLEQWLGMTNEERKQYWESYKNKDAINNSSIGTAIGVFDNKDATAEQKNQAEQQLRQAYYQYQASIGNLAGESGEWLTTLQNGKSSQGQKMQVKSAMRSAGVSALQGLMGLRANATDEEKIQTLMQAGLI